LVHIFQVPAVYGEIPVAAATIDEQIQSATETLKNLKRQMARRANYKINIDTDLKVQGSVVSQIESYCQTIKPTFVVMGSHGSSAAERLLCGSNTITAMKKLSSPLIIVPRNATFKKLAKIGFACDLRDVAETVPLKEIITLIKHFNAELHVIHINSAEEKNHPTAIMLESVQLRQMLDDFNPLYDFLDNVEIDEGIIECSEKNKLDLLIVIPKKHDSIERILHKSRSKQVVVHGHIPILSIHE